MVKDSPRKRVTGLCSFGGQLTRKREEHGRSPEVQAFSSMLLQSASHFAMRNVLSFYLISAILLLYSHEASD